MRFIFALRYVAVVILLQTPLWALAAVQTVGEGDAAGQIETAIGHAKTYCWLAAAEQGDLSALKAGTYCLAQAKQLTERLPPREANRFADQISAWQADLEGQTAALSDTLDGVFPLTPFLMSSPFIDSGVVATYQLIGDPAVKAARDAAEKLAARAADAEKDRRQLQLPVVVLGIPQNRTLDNQLQWVFRAFPRFRVHTQAEVATACTPGEMSDFLAGRITPEIKRDLLKGFGAMKLLVVAICPIDVTDEKVYCYGADGHFLDAAGETLVSTMGFSRDRRDRLAWIVWINAALLAVAFAAYALIVHTHRAATVGVSWKTLLAAPAIGFAVGRILPYAVSPLLGSLRVPPAAPLLAYFWVPCLVGAGFLGAPLACYWLACPWLTKLCPFLSPRNRGGAMFAAVGAGIAAYLAGPLLLYLEENQVIDVILMTTIVMVLAYLAGRALDYTDPLPLSLAVVPLVLTMPAGAALLNTSTTWLGCAAELIVAAGTAAVVCHSAFGRRRRNLDRAPAGQAELRGGIPASVQELIRRAESPKYQPFSSFDRGWERLNDFLQGRCCHLGFFGPRGAGKTAAVEALTNRLAQEFDGQGRRLVRLCGSCSQPMGEPMAYAPFRQALVQHFEVNLLAPPGPKIQQISQALGGLFGSVVPFGRILFSHSAADVDFAVRPEEIQASIAWMLRRLSKTQPILLFLDDVQWLDGASAALVKYLLKEFPAGSETPLAIVLAAHDKSCLANLGLDVARQGIEVAYPSVSEQAQILAKGVGVQPAVAEEVLAHIGPARETDGGLLWPLQMAANLARSGALAPTPEGFGWTTGAWPADLSIPTHMQAAIQEQWQSAASHRTVLECAACGCEGREFHASVLAAALGKPYLDVLVVLDEIERTTGMIHDVQDRDDIYAFHSSFLLEAIRGQLGILGQGPRKAVVPQIIREYHARLAAALEAALKTSPSSLYEVANHFYAAGQRYAAKGAEYCLQAAKASAAGYDFRRAKNYLDMAEECAEFSGAGAPTEVQKQIILCQEAQVTSQGEQRVRAMKAHLAYLQEHPAAPASLVLAVAGLCYEVGHRGRDQRWCEEAIRLCRQIVAHPASPQDEAQAHHIVGLCRPADRRAERIAELRKAYELLERSTAEDREALQCFAQVVNSLAKELGKGTPEERQEAKRLFEYRLRMDEEQRLNDLRGVAVAVAGLGRLALYNEPKDVPSAQKRFQRNLDISEAIGNLVGQVKMHSLLGACALETGRVDQAVTHYRRSLELAEDPVDRCFAGVGLLRCCQEQNRLDQFDAAAKDLLDLAHRAQIPRECKTQLLAMLKACPTEAGRKTIGDLLDLMR